MQQQRKNLIEIFMHQNSQINLSAIREADAIYEKHILDSIELDKVFPLDQLDGYQESKLQLIDVGTGGGFPLLPLATQYPKLQCIGLDARKKKCEAINTMVKDLKLDNVITARSRAEEYDHQADIVTARAVTYADKLFHRVLPLTKPGGYIVLYKLLTPEEDSSILTLTRNYHLTLTKLHHYHLPSDEVERVIYILQKKK